MARAFGPAPTKGGCPQALLVLQSWVSLRYSHRSPATGGLLLERNNGTGLATGINAEGAEDPVIASAMSRSVVPSFATRSEAWQPAVGVVPGTSKDGRARQF